MTDSAPKVSLALALTAFASTPVAALAQSEPNSNSPTTIRLIEHLEGARILSPLNDLVSAPNLDALEDPELDVLLEEGFEDFDWGYAGWPRIPAATIVGQDGARSLRLDASLDDSLGWRLPVQTDAFYRFTRSVQVDGVAFCDVYVVESSLEFDDETPQTREHFLSGRGAALKIHSIPFASSGAEALSWQTGSTTFYPTPRTNSLAVVFRPRVGADRFATVSAMRFDDLLLEQVIPSPEERIRLMKGAHLGPDADPDLGMRKAGRLLPLPSARGARRGEPAESNYNWRNALYVPPMTEVGFDLVVPQDARLRLATGLARETPPGASARFQIELVAPGAEARLLHDSVRQAIAEEWHWEEVDVDLSEWSGSEVTLTLRTTAEKWDAHPLWGNPRIEAAPREDEQILILIAVDTLRADRLSSYGYERETTPSLDRLADEGVRFDQARSNCNWTCPSFASIFTGLVPARHGVSSYGPATPLPAQLTTLAEHFQSNGWATRSIAYKVPLFEGNYEQGFDQAFSVPRDVIRGEENLARALEWLEDQNGGQSFLFLHFNDPHQPFVHPEPLDRKFGSAAPMFGAGGPDGQNAETRQKFAALYDGAVAYVDSCIGQFIDALRERGLYDRAAIVFVADHGEQLWEHGRFGHGGDDLYDEIVRVPLIVKPPTGSFEPGRVVAAEVSGFDVMPTLLELGGIGSPPGLDALSLLPLIHGDQAGFDRPVVTENSRRGLSLVQGGFKLVVALGTGERQLYDLKNDPGELEDVAPKNPAQVKRLSALTIAYLLEHRPGNYLLAHAGDAATTLSIGTEYLRTLIGAPATVDRANGPVRSVVELSSDEWALLQVEGADAGEVIVHGLAPRGPEEGFGPWIRGALPALKGPGVWRVHGPQSIGPVDTSANPVDAELLERLRALGYAE